MSCNPQSTVEMSAVVHPTNLSFFSGRKPYMMNHGDAERQVAVLEARICSLQEETELKIERGRETRVWPLLIDPAEPQCRIS